MKITLCDRCQKSQRGDVTSSVVIIYAFVIILKHKDLFKGTQ